MQRQVQLQGVILTLCWIRSGKELDIWVALLCSTSNEVTKVEKRVNVADYNGSINFVIDFYRLNAY